MVLTPNTNKQTQTNNKRKKKLPKKVQTKNGNDNNSTKNITILENKKCTQKFLSRNKCEDKTFIASIW